MANDLQSTLREMAINALQNSGSGGSSDDQAETPSKNGSSPLKGMSGLALGAGAAALAPVAAKKAAEALGMGSIGELLKSPGQALGGVTSSLGDAVGSGLGDKVTDKVDEAGGASGILSDTIKDVLPFGGGGGGSKNGAPGVGKGRRMPVQQSVDIGVNIETVYNQFTQFEDWPEFMHRVKRVTQDDDCTLTFATKIWARSKEFTTEIETQRPNERIKWKVTRGITHTGVVTFHELGPKLTRVMVNMDVDPGFPLEKAARGMRHIKRALRADLHRFAAFIEMNEIETGAWRGVIEEGELVEEHDPSYDEERQYADIDDLVDSDEDEDEEDEGEEDEQGEDDEQEDEEQEEDEEPDEDEQAEEEEEEPEPARARNGRNGRSARSTSAQRSSSGQSRSSNGQSRSSSGQSRSSRRSTSGHDDERRGQGRRTRRS